MKPFWSNWIKIFFEENPKYSELSRKSLKQLIRLAWAVSKEIRYFVHYCFQDNKKYWNNVYVFHVFYIERRNKEIYFTVQMFLVHGQVSEIEVKRL